MREPVPCGASPLVVRMNMCGAAGLRSGGVNPLRNPLPHSGVLSIATDRIHMSNTYIHALFRNSCCRETAQNPQKHPLQEGRMFDFGRRSIWNTTAPRSAR